MPNPTFMSSFSGHTNWVRSACFSPDSRIIASGSDDRTVKLWSVNDNSCIHTLHGHIDYVTHVAFHPQGTCVAACSTDRIIHIWDIRNQQLLQRYHAHSAAINQIAFHPEGRFLLSCSDDTKVNMWDLATGLLSTTFHVHQKPVRAVDWTCCDSIVRAATKGSLGRSGTQKPKEDKLTDFFVSGGDDKLLFVWKVNDLDAAKVEIDPHDESEASSAFPPPAEKKSEPWVFPTKDPQTTVPLRPESASASSEMMASSSRRSPAHRSSASPTPSGSVRSAASSRAGMRASPKSSKMAPVPPPFPVPAYSSFVSPTPVQMDEVEKERIEQKTQAKYRLLRTRDAIEAEKMLTEEKERELAELKEIEADKKRDYEMERRMEEKKEREFKSRHVADDGEIEIQDNDAALFDKMEEQEQQISILTKSLEIMDVRQRSCETKLQNIEILLQQIMKQLGM
ncbi:putative WD repeat-containing protein 51A [Monocercomonoides exilis]|uniref:putative WD repeat-containing protein 51A n=1 Tax=Monocercomonoides exilis TaxID=2049356 RepID=UPI003559B36B|nr:putative WD repeat-containing protein 51A [Monocercomonoides exilis]|eukprot:MONOS_13242.1-p1 / transcript=MONOS_13242.1 / gene=MONOS_13242 / organism=Monocercomonoides_exilis_PA203 / gene_product=WD repeat-containing protein 51A / transcript_product=WD repeat-containing protein 51A / location=Mono_scaffold00796:17482-19260(+) / protein_length=451 / sequence_SO=supercontig / SO=protein_coding / is_pseudo=false